MALKSGEIKSKPRAIRMDTIFIARRVIDMAAGDIGYVYRDTVAPQVKKSGKPGKVYVEGTSYSFNEVDIRTSYKEGGALHKGITYRNFLRLICVGEQAKEDEETKLFAVDASHLELGPHSVIDSRFSMRDWKAEQDVKPQLVVDFVGNSLDLPDMETRLAERYGFILQPNELSVIRDAA